MQWCDGQQSKIRMQEFRHKISGRKVGKGGQTGGKQRLTRHSESGEVVDVVDARGHTALRAVITSAVHRAAVRLL
jgi:hypothetical protein